MDDLHRGYSYCDASQSGAGRYLLPALSSIIKPEIRQGDKIFDLGCGNGATAKFLSALGYEVSGVDPSEAGIQIAKAAVPNARLEIGSAYDDLAGKYGQFRLVVSLEVVEHCFWPRKFAKTVFDLLEPGGLAVISTPYHGYLKNLLLALFNQFDRHWTALWDGGHIKFWSPSTLTILLKEAGFESVEYQRVGRLAPIAKSMIAIARRPPSQSKGLG